MMARSPRLLVLLAASAMLFGAMTVGSPGVGVARAVTIGNLVANGSFEVPEAQGQGLGRRRDVRRLDRRDWLDRPRRFVAGCRGTPVG
jgi:hypothetical protein